MIPTASLPDYVFRGGEQVWRPPFSARQVELYGLVTQAHKPAIDLLLQRDLVLPSGGAVDYRCAHENVIVTFGLIERESSGDPVDSQRGYLTEREVSVWCLVADMNAGGRLVWYLPYIYTDSEQTIATGREVFGYPKQLGYFDDGFIGALAGPAAGSTTIQTLAIDPFDPDERAVKRDMISIERVPGAGAIASQPSILQELELFFPHGLSVDPGLPSGPLGAPSGTITVAGSAPPARRPGLPPWITGILSALEGKVLTGDPSDLILDLVSNPTLVFLKQFRDITCATKACYQAVTEAPLAIDVVGADYEMLDPSLFRLTIENWASDPVARELGIDAGAPIIPDRAFRATFGFDIQLGLEVWRAPT